MKPSLFTRIRWRLEELRDSADGKAIGVVVLLGVLVLGGFLAARAVAGGSSSSTTQASVRVVTMRQKVRVRVHGRLVTRWQVRKVYAKAKTVLETQTIQTKNGIRVVTHPVTRYHVVYRKRVVREHGKTRTVLQPLTTTQTHTSTNTQLVTVTRQVTDTQVRTVTQPVTNLVTTTVVSTETDTVPVTVTVTTPITTG
jgi:hypothetical protein